MSDNPFGAGFVPNQMLQLLQQMQASGGELGAALGGGAAATANPAAPPPAANPPEPEPAPTPAPTVLTPPAASSVVAETPAPSIHDTSSSALVAARIHLRAFCCKYRKEMI